MRPETGSSKPEATKVDDESCVDAVGQVVMENFHERADVQSPRTHAATQQRMCTNCAAAPLSYAIPMASAMLTSTMAWGTLQLIRKTCYSSVCKGRGKTDIRGHCHLLEQQIRPGAWIDVRRCSETLQQLWQHYSQESYARRKLQRAEVDDPATSPSVIIVQSCRWIACLPSPCSGQGPGWTGFQICS